MQTTGWRYLEPFFQSDQPLSELGFEVENSFLLYFRDPEDLQPDLDQNHFGVNTKFINI